MLEDPCQTQEHQSQNGTAQAPKGPTQGNQPYLAQKSTLSQRPSTTSEPRTQQELKIFYQALPISPLNRLTNRCHAAHGVGGCHSECGSSGKWNPAKTHQAIGQEIEEMRRTLKEVPETIVEGMAFDNEILAEPIPNNYRPPRILENYGTTGPAFHLHRFQTTALLYQYSDKLKYHVFANTFKEDAELCQFQDLFMYQFNSGKHFRKMLFALYNVRQGDDESLHNYVRKFTATILEVLGTYKEVLANSFVNGLTEIPFFATLVMDPVEDYDELLAKEEKFINLEEVGPTKPKSDKFCQFHNDYSYDTNEFTHLRNEIEKLIKKGYLREFVADPGVVPCPGSGNVVLNTIELVSPASIIQFGLADLKGMDCPHQDVLVITATVKNYDEARVFVNCESLVDILFMKAFQQMDLRPINMEFV
ncbi:hypothetical protein CDL12_05545 [Handroanthus impetiginosus]|uniref:Retrotransposon gag domain-containing protein n=1 Tax=Handroanthus impetiginosus TaxID=429701 RepID=A0A2G9HW65_9LAMI|nr:hypothetical protein CDL12_05545 [Handroanthus impetiginosus]